MKTATFKELAPYESDWYYIRAASMARKIYLRGGIGVGAFKKIYGGRKSNGVRPSHFAKSSGSIARHCLKQLEALNIVEKDPKGSVIVHLLLNLHHSGFRVSSINSRPTKYLCFRVLLGSKSAIHTIFKNCTIFPEAVLAQVLEIEHTKWNLVNRLLLYRSGCSRVLPHLI